MLPTNTIIKGRIIIMRNLVIVIIATLMIMFCACSKTNESEINFDLVDSHISIWKDSADKYYIVLAYEISNSGDTPLYFKESDFDIVDENGTLIEVLKSVSAYPPVVASEWTSVYYEAKVSDKIADVNIKLKVIPHIEAEKTHIKKNSIFMVESNMWGGSHATGIIENKSHWRKYKDVRIAIISRKLNDEIVSVMTASIDLIKAGERVEFMAEDRLKERFLDPNLSQSEVTGHFKFIYIDP
jgi:hypothetical protein